MWWFHVKNLKTFKSWLNYNYSVLSVTLNNVFISYFIYDRKQAKHYCFSVLLKGPSIFFGFPDVRISPSRCLDGNQLFFDASHPGLPRRKFDNFVGRFYEELRNRRLVKLLRLKNNTSDRDRNKSVGR